MQTKKEKKLNISIEVYTNINAERVLLYARDSLKDLNSNIEELIKKRINIINNKNQKWNIYKKNNDL